ncbi:MAG TPA: RNA 2',3'-cyclic phosphodiesterase [Casimicrobiaceae bacterium]
MSASATQRVFFALWPDPPARASLAALAREVALESGGRPTLPGLIHLTLAFVGDQPAIRLDSLRRLAGIIRATSFVLALDKIGAFRRTGITWLGSSAPQPELLALQRDLADALRSKAFPVDERPYAPHLTLARRSTTVVERRLPQPVCWRVDAFTLVASETASGGPIYRTIALWPLVSV